MMPAARISHGSLVVFPGLEGESHPLLLPLCAGRHGRSALTDDGSEVRTGAGENRLRLCGLLATLKTRDLGQMGVSPKDNIVFPSTPQTPVDVVMTERSHFPYFGSGGATFFCARLPRSCA
jgi:hypothetical protein